MSNTISKELVKNLVVGVFNEVLPNAQGRKEGESYEKYKKRLMIEYL